MNTIWSKESDAILKVGHFLEGVGVRNWALTKEQMLIALKQFESEGIAILGGDVYEMQREIPQLSCDNWNCDRMMDETWSDFVLRSTATARNYIDNYSLDENEEYVFAIVPACRAM